MITNRLYNGLIMFFCSCTFMFSFFTFIHTYPNECKSTIPVEAKFEDTSLCDCINCDRTGGTRVPDMTVEQLGYNLDHMDWDLPEELPSIGDTIGLYNPTEDKISIIHGGYRNGPKNPLYNYYRLTE